MKYNRTALKISIYYLIFGLLWIILSDQLAELAAFFNFKLSFLQTIKGSIFVIITAILLYKVIKAYIVQIESESKKTMRFLDNIGVLVISLDSKGNILFINKKGLNLLNCDYDSCIGRNFINTFFPEKVRNDATNRLQRLFDGDTACGELIYPVVTKDKKEIMISFDCSLLEDRKNGITSLLCTGKDVTARIETEKIANKMLHVVEQSPNCVVITDTNGNIEYVNKKFIELTGYSLEEVKGKNPRILKSGKTDQKTYKELWGKITKGEAWEGEFCNRKKSGEFYWEYAKISPLKDPESGKVINFIGIKEDITYERKLEAELLHAQKMEAIGNLAGGIAHDFNNILTAIIGYGNVLMMKLSENDPLRVYVEQILAASERAATLTQNILTFARKQPAIKKLVNLNEVVEHISKMLIRIIGEHIEYRTSFQERELNILADPIQIEQILMNLASNARDAMRAGGILSIETMHFLMDEEFIKNNGFGKAGEYVLLKVSDTGCGMDEYTKTHLFEPFFTTKETGKGTGLGLSIVYGIVKSNDGFLKVESEEGKGTVFFIYFPLTRRLEEHFECQHIEKKSLEGNETVLLAEDDKLVREMIKDYLETYNYKVLTAANGEEAVEVFKEHKSDVSICILDVVMPKKSGIIAYKEIHLLNPNIKAIIISGYKTEIEQNAQQFGKATVFIQKPVSPRELIRTARELLDK